jgi:hypothetical protein
MRWGTFAAGGSDSSCYLNEAVLLSQGRTHIEQPLIVSAPWPNAEWTFTPAGYRPSPVRKDFLVPICPPGLSLLMAAAKTVRISMFLIVPLCGALAAWWTFLLGRGIAGPLAGAASAVLLVCSPVFLFQVVQPMTDVPAAAWWLCAAALAGDRDDRTRRPFTTGLAASIAVLIRPNLLPLAGIVALYLAALSGAQRRQAVVRFLAGFAPGVLVLAALQRAMYGSPIGSGYGSTADLFHAGNLLANLERYGRWLYETHTPFLALAVVAPFVANRAAAWLCLLLAAATAAAYLPYQVFNDWWYLRFLLPAIAWLIVLAASTFAHITRRWLPRYQTVGMALVVGGLGATWIGVARERAAFELQRMERPFIEAGTFVAAHLPDRAVVLTVRHSGSVYYYSRRSIVSWDTLEPGSLNRTLAFLRAQGLTPVVLIETAEEPEFRMRFGAASEAGGLDWPPMARIGRTIRVYDPSDRSRYLSGATIQTIEWPPPKRS